MGWRHLLLGWQVRRTLQFLGALMRRVVDDETQPLAALARAAYADELERYHGWLLRKTFGVALSAMPSRAELLARLVA